MTSLLLAGGLARALNQQDCDGLTIEFQAFVAVMLICRHVVPRIDFLLRTWLWQAVDHIDEIHLAHQGSEVFKGFPKQKGIGAIVQSIEIVLIDRVDEENSTWKKPQQSSERLH